MEDLRSTNGTRVDGALISKAEIGPGQEVLAGPVVVYLHIRSPGETAPSGLDGHDRFLAHLDREIVRARTFERPLTVWMLRPVDEESVGLGELVSRIQTNLRPVDAMGLYAGRTLLVALPEIGSHATAVAASPILAGSPPLLCGVAEFPADGASSQELIAAARVALSRATRDAPIAYAADGMGRTQSAVVVSSPRMRELYDTLDRVATSNAPVLIQGETGVGKEVIARAIHERSRRKNGPLRAVNCGALPESLLEGLLFGHEKGAFTGAERRSPGLFEQADKGTLFLDEVGELSASAQASLLRVLETKSVRRLGSEKEIALDVRVITATHRDLEAMCEAGQFRWDLFYRINTVTIEIPALRDRKEEIEPLARAFLRDAVAAHGQPAELDDAAVKCLVAYHWPGNVRELRNAIERSVLVAKDGKIGVDALPSRIRERRTEPDVLGMDDTNLRDRVRRFESNLIIDALKTTGGNRTRAAELLEIPVRTLNYKIRSYDIDPKLAAD